MSLLLFLLQIECLCKENKENVAFYSAFHEPSSEDSKQTNSMQTRAFLKLDKKFCTILLRALSICLSKG